MPASEESTSDPPRESEIGPSRRWEHAPDIDRRERDHRDTLPPLIAHTLVATIPQDLGVARILTEENRPIDVLDEIANGEAETGVGFSPTNEPRVGFNFAKDRT